jgi:aryl-alcohol dehydrogenase-like predicted oxidoreductase
MRAGRSAQFVLGSVQLGLPYGAANRSGKPPRETALRLVRRAANAGVAVFDTARAYGDAEERLGAALGGRRSVCTVTKLAPLSELASDASRETVRAAVDQSIAESCAALRVASLDCLLLHRASHITAHDGAIWERLEERVVEGAVRALGVSVQSPAEAHAALAQSSASHIQLPFNILDWRWREAGVIAALAARPDVTVHARSVFLQGLLAANDPAVWPKIAGVDAPAVVAWLNESRRSLHRESVADLALAYARGQSWIDGVVVGQETEAQLDENLRLCTLPALSGADCDTLEASRPRLPQALLDPAQWRSQ